MMDLVKLTQAIGLRQSPRRSVASRSRYSHIRSLYPTMATRQFWNIITGMPRGGVKTPASTITRDGFAILAMGYTGSRAMKFKLAYIDAFNRMEAPPARPSRNARIIIDDFGPEWGCLQTADLSASICRAQLGSEHQRRESTRYPMRRQSRQGRISNAASAHYHATEPVRLDGDKSGGRNNDRRHHRHKRGARTL